MIPGIKLLPSIFTAANMGLGFYSMTASMREDWAVAAWCIIGCILLDVLDGRIARMANATSKFGLEFDSLSDLTSFCVAPAVMIYVLILQDYGRLGFALAFFYLLCGAIRLARYNVKANSESEATPYFTGLPTPAAGGILASFVILYDIWSLGKKARTIKIVMSQIPFLYHFLPVIIFVLSILMVSNLRYSAMKRPSRVKSGSVRLFLAAVLGCLMIYIYPQNTIFILFVGYILSGFIEYFWRLYNVRNPVHQFKVENPNDEDLQNKKKGLY